MSLPVTLHFDIDEFDSHDGVLYPVGNSDDDGRTWLVSRLQPLCVALEVVRTELGDHPIRIVSGYRSPAHNAAVGGALKSQHMEGRAADITVDGAAPSDVHAAVLHLVATRQIEIGGLGLYPSWVHVDVRPRPADGHLAQWTGVKIGDEVA